MKLLNKLLAMALVAVTIVATAISAAAVTGLPTGSTAYTIKGDVAVRRTPAIADNIITRVNTGTQVRVLQSTHQSNGFYKVYISGVTNNGYIREDCLGSSAPGSSTPVGQDMYCNTPEGTWVNIRKYASQSSLSLGRLYRGDMAYVVSSDGTWSKISSPMNGYVLSSYLQPNDPGGGGNYVRPQTWEEAFGPSGIIQKGNFGYKVANIQIVLGIAEDAMFGKDTDAAVRAFQKSKDLKVDGLVGEQTKRALWKAGEASLKYRGYAIP